MTVSFEQGAAQAVPAFDPARWFAAWSDNGGIAVATTDRLIVSRIAALHYSATERLNELRGQIMHREAASALAAHLRGFSGEGQA